MGTTEAEFAVDFPTMGDLVSQWIEQHCRIPDRHERGRPFREYDWQFWCTANRFRVREDAEYDTDNPPLNQAFTYRQSQVIAPQKIGKGPWTACHVAVAAVGPAEFAGWAAEGDAYRCEDHGCGCGWVFGYEPGEPMGRRNPSPLVQVLATSEEQVGNIWRPLTTMIGLGPLSELLLPRGEFIRVVDGTGGKDMDRIDRVTASAKSRLGAPLSEGFFDESGLYVTSNSMIEVADTMRRNAAGMGGRTTETTNAYNPAEMSYAQVTQESTRPDVFKFWRNPDGANGPRRKDGTQLSFKDARERRKILAYVYGGARHINLASIEAEVQKLNETDPAQAERFFGNRLVKGQGAWLDEGLWEAAWADAVAS